MGRLVKMWDTGEKLDKDLAYHAPDGKNYSSQAAYEKLAEEKKYWKYCVDEIMFLLGYEEGMKPNTYIFKLLRELKGYGYDVIYDTMIEKTKDIQWALNTKSFRDETNKIKYIFAIITNNAMDVYMVKQAKTKKNKKGAAIIEIDDFKPHKQKVKDISRYLDDDDE